MDKFRYSLDFGVGYQLVDVYNNNLKMLVGRGVSDLVATKKLSGSISFVGTLAETLYNERTNSYKVPFKVEEYNGTVWADWHECYADIRGDYKRLSTVITISNFNEFETPATKIGELLKNRYKTSELGLTKTTLLQDVESDRLDVYSDPSALTPAEWQERNGADGVFDYNTVPTFDTKWNYFFFVGTTGISPALVHQWSCNIFNFPLSEVDGWNGFYKEIFDNSSLWMKVTTAPYTVESFTITATTNSYRLDDVLNKLASKLDPLLSFTSTDGGGFESDKQYLGETNEFLGEEVVGVDISLGEIFHIIRHLYRSDWYIDANKLKFRFNPLLYTDTSTDWSTETINTDEIKFSDPPLPDREVFSFLDPNRNTLFKVDTFNGSTFPYSKFTISYFEKGVPTDLNIKDWSIDMYSDFFAVKQGNAEKNKGIWFRHDGTDIQTLDSRDLYLQTDGFSYGGANGERYAEYSPIFYIDTANPASDYTSITGTNAITRPIYEMVYNKWLNEYNLFSLFNEITFSGGNTGFLNRYEVDMKTGNGKFYIRFQTINL